MRDYDVVIIGAGPGGYNAAIRAAQLGMKVACVEKRPTLGGTCLNVGCMPSKALLHASKLYAAAGEQFAQLGIEATPRLNLPRMMQQTAESVDRLTKGVEFLFRKNKVDWLKGAGRLAGPGKVEVEAADGALATVAARHIVIATGSQPFSLPGVVVDGDRIVDSTGALSLKEVPARLVVIGAGVIGLELGSVWRRLGADVTVIEFLDRISPGMDAEVAAALQATLTRQGLQFKLGRTVTGARPSKDGVEVSFSAAADGETETLEADCLLVAVGREPNTGGLGLGTVGIAPDRSGFIETDGLKTSAHGVWAIGDVTHGPMLAHRAEEDAIAAIEAIAGRFGESDHGRVPCVVYTSPEVAWIGQTEEELKACGRAYKTGKFPFSANSRAQINREAEGFVKVLADAATEEVLGVHMIGPGVSELIGEYCVAMAFRANAEDIARVCHPHPTRSEALRQAAMGASGWMMQA